MRALVVYESMFGNTRAVAQAIADGIGTAMPVVTVEVGEAPAALDPDIGLLVVGGPTHMHGMSSPKSRANAAERAGGPVISAGPGMAEWIGSLRATSTVVAASFDTRTEGPTLFTGSAATGAAKLLRKAGLKTVEPHSFVLSGPRDQLADRIATDQLDAARAWGAGLAAERVRSA